MSSTDINTLPEINIEWAKNIKCDFHAMGDRMRIAMYLNTIPEEFIGHEDLINNPIVGKSYIYGACTECGFRYAGENIINSTDK